MLSELIIAEGEGEPALFNFVPLFPASLCCSALPGTVFVLPFPLRYFPGVGYRVLSMESCLVSEQAPLTFCIHAPSTLDMPT